MSRVRTTTVFCLSMTMFGCSERENGVAVTNPFSPGTVLAVAPILNFSGELSLDPVKLADLLASELSGVEGVVVLPVNRVLAVLAGEGKYRIESADHAVQVGKAIGADGILVAGLTEYDPYTPVVGVVLQLYSVSGKKRYSKIDPVLVARLDRPLPLVPSAGGLAPEIQVQAVYNALQARVVDAVHRFAERRSEGDNPLGWRQYLKVQSLYLRFCWHDALERLMEQVRLRHAGPSAPEAMEDAA